MAITDKNKTKEARKKERKNTWIGIGDEGSDGKEELGDGHGRAPALFENAESENAGGVDVAVVDPGLEVHLSFNAMHE